MWSKGDGGLVKLYPQYAYWDVAPNSAEMLLVAGAMVIFAGLTWLMTGSPFGLVFSGKLACAILVANIVHDVYRHLFRDAERTKAMKTTVSGIPWVAAVLESSLIRMASEGGRVIGILERGEAYVLGKRFDWFTGRAGKAPQMEERKNTLQRFSMVMVLMAIATLY
ncbi:hypothetical protein GLOTRDRAFT_34704 [Gloeophyllum trabeum ATCC 11539]|uniref:Uncharacterized protein n=1 Tax=Gloeophyllum trabeum (strain ATCC 11539 / FP-39264 / Madison 617) TaxID=670483 RepID=S7QKF3_GLOTA|nr:uncharacterized protein GLOTRDRAFT_34704 [Gloeophyllum trabeum ATCC 11539]EPQ59718.1 hypothetical protein GLOTRDRAFT_34704 [Gloeophyllum trabeum ATCC 11539]